MGDQAVRRRLFMGALGGVRGDKPLRAFYQRLVGRGKPKLVALVAAARKLLIWAWAVFRRQTVFDATRLVPAGTASTEPDARAYACVVPALT